MTTLTPNRIIQQGDEYIDAKGTWKPVPKDDYGLQVMFTKYAAVRRPAEEPPKETTTVKLPHIGRTVEVLTPQDVTSRNLAKRVAEVKANEPISPDSEKPRQTSQEIADPVAIVTAKAESEPVAPHRIAPVRGERSIPDILENFERVVEAAGLPTVISKKAHEAPWIKEHVETHPTMTEPERIEKHTAILTHPTINVRTPERLRVAAALVTPPEPEPLAQNGIIKIAFPKPDPTDLIAMSTQPIWTGRNGTFTGYGLEAMIANDNIMLSPIGKRGIGNGCIQFPKSVIPQLVDWLLRQQNIKDNTHR